MRNIMLFIISIIVIGSIAIIGCGPKPKPKEANNQSGKPVVVSESAAPVSVVTLQPMDLEEKVNVTGTLKPLSEVSVGNRLAGRILDILVREGTPVKRGTVLAHLESQDAEAQVSSAKAAVYAAKARLEQAKAAVEQQSTATASGIQTARAGVDAAVARWNQAKTTATSTEATVKAAEKSAQAMLDAANSRLLELKNGSRTQERAVAESQVRMAKANYDGAKRDYDRYVDLYNQGAVARSLQDKYETALQVAKAQLDSAQEQLSLVKEGPREEDIQAGEAAVRQAQEGLATARANLTQIDVARANVAIAETGVSQAKAALDSALASREIDVMRDKDVLAAKAAVQQANEALITAKNNLGYNTILSPVDGVVSKQIAEVGQTLGANVAILSISTNSTLYFEAGVSELEATRLRSGQSVELTVDALQGNRTDFYQGASSKLVTGTVERVVPVVDAHTRNFNVRISVQRSQALYPGMFVRGSVVVARHPRCLAVKKDALLEKEDKQIVFVADKGIAHQRVVIPGASDSSGNVQVLSGLQQDEQVVIVGQQTLKDGDKIMVVPDKGGSKM